MHIHLQSVLNLNDATRTTEVGRRKGRYSNCCLIPDIRVSGSNPAPVLLRNHFGMGFGVPADGLEYNGLQQLHRGVRHLLIRLIVHFSGKYNVLPGYISAPLGQQNN